MNLENVKELWKQDSKIDKTILDEESLKTSQLHSKYFNIYLTCSKQKRELKKTYYTLMNVKKRYYLGTIDKEELEKNDWAPFQLKVTTTNLQTYLDSDNDLIDLSMKIGEVEEQIEFLKSIIEFISKRGFQIKNCIDFIKFQNGIE